MAGLRSTVHNRLRHGELPLTAFLRRSCGFDTVTPTPTFALNPPLAVSPLSLATLSFHFQSHPSPTSTGLPAHPEPLAALKAILNRRHRGSPFSFLSLFFIVLTLKSVRGSLPPCSPCTVILNFTQFSVLGVGGKRTKREMKVRDVLYGESGRKLPDIMDGVLAV